MKIDINQMPDDMREQTIRMHHRMQAWRTKNPKADVSIFWKEPTMGKSKIVVVATIRDAMMLGLVHTNDQGFNMLKAMCETENPQPTVNQVRTAIEMDI